MKRIILFSQPTEENIEPILKLLFPDSINKKIFAYMPSNGANCPQEYIDQWKEYSDKNGAEFRLIDNDTRDSEEEVSKLLGSNILLITGGNTFTLLNNLRNSGLDKAIRLMSERDDFIIAGFSAGAIVLSPNIEICNLPDFDENTVELSDLIGLGIIDFEVFPHYEDGYQKLFEGYQKLANNEVKTIREDEYIVIEK